MSHISVATSNRRLLKLAAFLDALPPERFNYAHWVGPNWDGEPDLGCGTTACALGWATTMPEFRRLGLRMSKLGAPILVGMNEIMGDPPIEAAQKVFGVTRQEAVFLFEPGHGWRDMQGPDLDADAEEVAEHIRRFVRERVVE